MNSQQIGSYWHPSLWESINIRTHATEEDIPVHQLFWIGGIWNLAQLRTAFIWAVPPTTGRIQGEIYWGVHCRHHSASSSLQNGKGKPRTQLVEKSNKRALTAGNHSVAFPSRKEKLQKNLPKAKSYVCLSNTKGTGCMSWFSSGSFFFMWDSKNQILLHMLFYHFVK